MDYAPERDPARLLEGVHGSEEKSWHSGGTAGALPAERARASFDVQRMAQILDGSKEFRAKKTWINSSAEDFTGPVVDSRKYDLERSESIRQSLKNFMDIHKPHFDRGYLPQEFEISYMQAAAMMGGYPGYGLFLSTVLQQSSPEQQGWWLLRTVQCQITGCYAQTELGHGSNVRGLETTARYDAETETFVLDTPTLTSMKFWPSSMVSATHAVVYAQLFIQGKAYGVHSFMVQLRDELLRPLPGIEVGDVGAKVGETMIDIGYLRLQSVRVPRTCMFAKRQHVEPDGTYVKHGGSGSKGTGAEKMQYLTMMMARSTMVGGAASALAKAVVIAVRYAAVRRQGFKDTTEGVAHDSEENQILDYKMTQYRLFKQLAFAVANRFVYNWFQVRKAELTALVSSSVSTDAGADLPELHATSAGLKGICCDRAALGIEDCRKACGGAGYLLSSGIAAIEADYKWRATAEGDTVIMLLQTARFLIKSLGDARRGEPLSGLAKCLAPMKHPGYNPLTDSRPSMPSTIEGWMNPEFLLQLLEHRTIVTVVAADAALQKCMKQGMTFDQAWQELTLTMARLGETHTISFMFTRFKETVDQIEDAACKSVLTRLCAFFGLAEVVDGGQWAGLLSAADAGLADAAVGEVCRQLRPEAVLLVDAWEFPDHILNSTIGRYDGNVYEATYSASVRSPLNKKLVPEWMDVMTPHLDVEFLAKRNGEEGAANYTPADAAAHSQQAPTTPAPIAPAPVAKL